jgi:hypothetical protein
VESGANCRMCDRPNETISLSSSISIAPQFAHIPTVWNNAHDVQSGKSQSPQAFLASRHCVDEMRVIVVYGNTESGYWSGSRSEKEAQFQ